MKPKQKYSLLKDRFKVVFGVEIEAEYNDCEIDVYPSDYHESGEQYDEYDEEYTDRMEFYKDYFFCETDSSINTEEFDATCEFISVPFYYEDRKEIIGAFNHEQQLNELFNFNSSCGAHIHFSVYDTLKDEYYNIEYREGYKKQIKGKKIHLRPLITMKELLRIRTRIQERIKSELPHIYDEFMSQYDRSYARTLKDIDDGKDNREREFNINSRTIEFRSFNLKGVKTWDDFNKMYDIALTEIHKTLIRELSKKQSFKKELRLTF